MTSNTTRNTGHLWCDAASALQTIGNLQADRRFRDALGLFFVEGIRNFVTVVDTQCEIAAIVYSERLLTAPLARKIVRQKRRQGVPTIRVTPKQFRTFSQTERASGVSAIVRQRWRSLRQTRPLEGLCWVILGQVRSVGNLGTLIRTSEAIGGAGFMLLDRQVDPYSNGAIRASMGALFRQHFIRTSMPALRRWTKQNSCYVVGASPDGAVDYQHFNYPRNSLVFLGEERGGLTDTERQLCHQLVSIPMIGQADSLNLGVAGSLMLYELHRVRAENRPKLPP